jgi:hypothetical protein
MYRERAVFYSGSGENYPRRELPLGRENYPVVPGVVWGTTIAEVVPGVVFLL